MPDDFGIIRARLFADDRAHHAAELYVKAGIAVEATALATVVGHVAMLGVWTFRETNDGIIPGDGIATVATAANLGPLRSVARTIVAALHAAQLLRDAQGGLYLVGFEDCYGSILKRRAKDAKRKADERAREDEPAHRAGRAVADLPRTSSGRNGSSNGLLPLSHGEEAIRGTSAGQVPMSGRTGPDRTGQDRTPPALGGSAAPVAAEGEGPATLSPADLAVLKLLTDKARSDAGSFSVAQRKTGRALGAILRDRPLDLSSAEALTWINETTPANLEPVRKVRMTFAMADKAREPRAKAAR